MPRASTVLYLAALALLPWGVVPRFPWLHEHAQWSDAVFAAAAAAWALEHARDRRWPPVRPAHVAMAGYAAWTAVSFAAASDPPPSAAWKVVGVAELVTLAWMTADVASQPGRSRSIAAVIAASGLLTAAAATGGVVLAMFGHPTVFVGGYGDLVPGPYARARAGLLHPNLLASFCIFAVGAVGRSEPPLPRRFRFAVVFALAVATALTFSRGILAFALALAAGRAPHRLRLAAAGAAVVAVALAALTIWNLEVDPTRPHEARISPMTSSRWQALTTAVASVRARPWLGTGPGTRPALVDGLPFDAHCTPLNIAATVGLPALAAFAAIPVLLWRGRRRPIDGATWAALAGIGLDALAQDVEDFRHVWVLFGLAAAGPSLPNVAAPRAAGTHRGEPTACGRLPRR